jgi:hypothetical protein
VKSVIPFPPAPVNGRIRLHLSKKKRAAFRVHPRDNQIIIQINYISITIKNINRSGNPPSAHSAQLFGFLVLNDPRLQDEEFDDRLIEINRRGRTDPIVMPDLSSLPRTAMRGHPELQAAIYWIPAGVYPALDAGPA